MNNIKELKLDRYIFIRNLIAFICASLIIIFTFWGVTYGLLEKPNEITPERGVFIFHLFTVNSNLLSLASAILVVSFTIQGLLKKKYEVPSWAFQVLYCATICVFLTFNFSLALILPRNGVSAVIGMNLFLHILCPILCVILFFMVSTDKHVNLLNSILVMIPFGLYALVYAIMVLILGEENGGWRDIYHLFTYIPWYLVLIVMVPAVFGISSLFRFLHNLVVNKRNYAVESYVIREYKDLSKDELIDLAHSIGYYSIKDSKAKTIPVPLKDLYLIAKSNKNVELKDLVDSFSKGYLDHLKELNQ